MLENARNGIAIAIAVIDFIAMPQSPLSALFGLRYKLTARRFGVKSQIWRVIRLWTYFNLAWIVGVRMKG